MIAGNSPGRHSPWHSRPPDAVVRVTGDDRSTLAADLKKRYEKGESIRLLAASSGRSYGFVHRILSESGTTLRGRGGATRKKKDS